VVKALALGASLERGVGSNPTARTFFSGAPTQKKSDTFSICACHPCAGAMLIFSVSFQFYRMRQVLPCSGQQDRCLLFSRTVGSDWSHATTLGGVAHMVERLLCMQEAQGSIPCSSTFFFVWSTEEKQKNIANPSFDLGTFRL
jgi:hypothetical protein